MRAKTSLGRVTLVPCLWLLWLVAGPLGTTSCRREPPAETRTEAATRDDTTTPVPRSVAPDEPSPGLPAPSTMVRDKPKAQRRSAQRTHLCEAYSSPKLGVAQLSGHRVITAHCGARVILLWAQPRDPNAPDPQTRVHLNEVLSLQYDGVRPNGQALGSDVTVGDINADGVADLLVGLPVVDAQDAPASGGVYALFGTPSAGKTLQPPRKLLGAHPLALAFGSTTERGDASLLILHGEDDRSKRDNELWYVEAGVEAARGHVEPLFPGAQLLSATDLDGDGIVDPVLANPGGGVDARLSNSAPTHAKGAQPPTPSANPADTQWPTTGVRAAATGDVDGDGALDLVLLGEQAWWVRGRDQPGAGQPAPEPIPDVACPAAGCGDQIQVIDADRDSRADLVMFHHPELIMFRQVDALRFERQAWLSIVGDGISVVGVQLDDANGDGALDLLALCRDESTATYSLAFVSAITANSILDVSGPAHTALPAPLRPRYLLPH